MQEYLEWLDCVAGQWQRILKQNGSLYCFASPQMAARVELLLGQRFNVLNRITWNKSKSGGRHSSCCKEHLKRFFYASETIIFCESLQNDYHARCSSLHSDIFEPLRAYLAGERKRGRFTAKQIIKATRCYTVERHAFARCQFELPTQQRYRLLQQAFPGYFERPYNQLKHQYDQLKQKYNQLKQQYKRLRRPFKASPEAPYTDVWEFPPVPYYPGKHPCEKPLSLIGHIIRTSTRSGWVVLDPFAGSGTTAVAAIATGRNYIAVEQNPDYCEVAEGRISEALQSAKAPR